MPKIGIFLFNKALMLLIAYSHGSGSPGPFDKKTPSGLRAITSSEVVFAGTTVTLQPLDTSILNIFFLIPKS